jgi:hypothetical protein
MVRLTTSTTETKLTLSTYRKRIIFCRGLDFAGPYAPLRIHQRQTAPSRTACDLCPDIVDHILGRIPAKIVIV